MKPKVKIIQPLIVNADHDFGIIEKLVIVEDGEEIQLQIENSGSESYISLAKEDVKALIDRLNIWYKAQGRWTDPQTGNYTPSK